MIAFAVARSPLRLKSRIILLSVCASFPSIKSLFFKDSFFIRGKKTKKKEIFFSFFFVFFLDATNTRESLRTHKTKKNKKGARKKGRKKGFFFFRWLRIKSRLSVVLFLCFFVLSIFIRDPFDPHHHHHRNIMSNDEEKEEDEVRRRRQSGGGKQQQNFLLLLFFRAFRCTRRAILDFFGARDRRAMRRVRLCRGISRNLVS